MARRRIGHLQPITREDSRLSVLKQIRAFCQGGVDWVQLRLKNADQGEFRDTALRAREITADADVALILDDRVGLVEEVKADGVHLGEKDMPPDKARRVLGDGVLIGGTADRFERVQELAPKTDYIGCGPFRHTSTKKALSPLLGLEGYRRILKNMEEEGIEVPILAIGGIRKEDIPDLLKLGIHGIAVSSAITEAKDPVRATADYLEMLEKAGMG